MGTEVKTKKLTQQMRRTIGPQAAEFVTSMLENQQSLMQSHNVLVDRVAAGERELRTEQSERAEVQRYLDRQSSALEEQGRAIANAAKSRVVELQARATHDGEVDADIVALRQALVALREDHDHERVGNLDDLMKVRDRLWALEAPSGWRSLVARWRGRWRV